MDHAAILASRAGCALLLEFTPLQVLPIPIPDDWCFLVAHSLTSAEKSGAAMAAYNERRIAGARALKALRFESYRSAVEAQTPCELTALATQSASAGRLTQEELGCFLHVTSESFRVTDAAAALRNGDAVAFGQLLSASHASLRDQLQVSSEALDSLVNAALNAGAFGARLTGAGFGGCVVILCKAAECDRVSAELVKNYYSHRAGFDPQKHLFVARPSAGALCG
jgi:galactokinase